MKTKIHYIITALLTIACVYLAWQLQGVKRFMQAQSELNDSQGELNQAVYENMESLYKRR